MQPIHTFNVVPKLPTALEPLRELALNLWWTWEPDARALFHQLDADLWHTTNHSPVRMLQLAKQSRLEELAGNDDFLRQMELAVERFRSYMSRTDTWWKSPEANRFDGLIAYFSAEFGF